MLNVGDFMGYFRYHSSCMITKVAITKMVDTSVLTSKVDELKRFCLTYGDLCSKCEIRFWMRSGVMDVLSQLSDSHICLIKTDNKCIKCSIINNYALKGEVFLMLFIYFGT